MTHKGERKHKHFLRAFIFPGFRLQLHKINTPTWEFFTFFKIEQIY